MSNWHEPSNPTRLSCRLVMRHLEAKSGWCRAPLEKHPISLCRGTCKTNFIERWWNARKYKQHLIERLNLTPSRATSVRTQVMYLRLKSSITKSLTKECSLPTTSNLKLMYLSSVIGNCKSQAGQYNVDSTISPGFVRSWSVSTPINWFHHFLRRQSSGSSIPNISPNESGC
jgi:hypothetical protein